MEKHKTRKIYWFIISSWNNNTLCVSSRIGFVQFRCIYNPGSQRFFESQWRIMICGRTGRLCCWNILWQLRNSNALSLWSFLLLSPTGKFINMRVLTARLCVPSRCYQLRALSSPVVLSEIRLPDVANCRLCLIFHWDFKETLRPRIIYTPELSKNNNRHT
jgi:hypothetical protein